MHNCHAGLDPASSKNKLSRLAGIPSTQYALPTKKMYDINDTIAALSSPPAGTGTIARSIIRMSGSRALSILAKIFRSERKITKRGIVKGKVCIDSDFEIEATVYAFSGPASYTGEDLVEIHVFAAEAVIQRILAELLGEARLAGPGEFTMRAYLNGKMDLSQAEAVAEIVAGSNKFQLAAAQKLLSGKLGDATIRIRQQLLDLLSLTEAGLDFSGEDIEFITPQKTVETISSIQNQLTRLLADSIRCEEEINLPAVGLAGVPNAGKSSLLNALLGKDRSIVSAEPATTRDVLTGVLELDRCDCALFDCAGLLPPNQCAGILDTLAQEAAVEALNSAQLVVFCVDADKSDYAEDVAAVNSLQPKELVFVATKCDLLRPEQVGRKTAELNKLFEAQFTSTSSLTGNGLSDLPKLIENTVASARAGAFEAADRIAITERHRKVVCEAMRNLTDASDQINQGNDEVAAMLLRAAYDQLGGLEREDIDEAVLERIFSNFCIGK
ncbi:MAG: tRNA uridine-5-carboxymethylaminomethyl(34) synthesis GTPase MnmE [Planctomycetota bacterium]|jgi:tRNA modification GTPase